MRLAKPRSEVNHAGASWQAWQQPPPPLDHVQQQTQQMMWDLQESSSSNTHHIIVTPPRLKDCNAVTDMFTSTGLHDAFRRICYEAKTKSCIMDGQCCHQTQGARSRLPHGSRKDAPLSQPKKVSAARPMPNHGVPTTSSTRCKGRSKIHICNESAHGIFRTWHTSSPAAPW